MIRQLNSKYMNRYLSNSVIQIKDTYTPLYEKYTGKVLDYKWFNCWHEQVAAKHQYDYNIKEELLKLFLDYIKSGDDIETFCQPSLLWKYEELTLAYFQSYMFYKVAGIRFEIETIKEFQELQPDLVETSKYTDHNFKIDCTYKKIAIQIKNYNFSFKMAEEFYNSAVRYDLAKRYVYYGTDGAYERIEGVWIYTNIKELLK